MPTYVWTAKDKSGKQLVLEVEGRTVEESMATLAGEGYSDLVLKVNDIMNAATAGFRKKSTVSRLKHRENPTVTFWDALSKAVEANELACIALVCLAAYAAYRGSWGYAFLLIDVLLAWMAFVLFVSQPSVYFKKLVKASDWHKWDEVLRLIRMLELLNRFCRAKIPATELARNRAKALAGLGRLDEALAEYRQCEGRPNCPTWLYNAQLAVFFDLAKQHDKAIEYTQLSIAEKPTSTCWADLANRYARHKRDSVRARQAMAEAEKLPMVDLSKPFRIRCQGIIAYLEGDYASASRDLKTAIDLVEKARGRPFRDGHLSVARAYLSCVLAKQGDLPAAQRAFALAQDYLVATQEDELLAECQRAIFG